jgi:tRNA (Thr-GGU) A37 N-methylase
VELLKHEGRIIIVKNLDAIDGTPVLDVKPVFKEFMPQNEIAQPNWVSDIMKPTGKNIQIKPTNFE